MSALPCRGCRYYADGKHQLVHCDCPRHGASTRAPKPRRKWRQRRRSVTVSAGPAQGTKAARELRRQLDDFTPTTRDLMLLAERPLTRGECQGGERPCPYVSCKHHLYLDVNAESGSIKMNFPDLDVWELKETCSLDVADRGGITLEEVGDMVNLTRERIRQVEVRGLLKLKMVGPGEEPIPGDPDYGRLEPCAEPTHLLPVSLKK